MNRFNHHPSKEYSEFKETVQEYAREDHDPGEDVYRALADALQEHLRDRFKSYWSVDERADTACIRRVITGEVECPCTDTRSWEERELERIGGRDDPPHDAPHEDHAELWLDDGEPVVYSMHVSAPETQTVSETAARGGQTQRNGWFDLLDFAREWGLEFAVTPWSHYHAFSRVNIVLYSPEWAKAIGQD